MKTTTMGDRLKAMRKAARMSQMDVAVKARQDLPEPLWIDQSKVSRLESGKISEEDAYPFDVCYLATLYGRRTSDASVLASERLELVRDLVARNAWTSR
jgi:transcriptional regulator with XRE-family HTH domain